MTPPKYPLTEALGLKVRGVCDIGTSHHNPYRFDAIEAAHLERILSESMLVYGYLTSDEAECNKLHKTPWHVNANFNERNTHTARLLCVQPIVREEPFTVTRAKLLEVFAGALGVPDASGWTTGQAILRLLGGKGEGV